MGVPGEVRKGRLKKKIKKKERQMGICVYIYPFVFFLLLFLVSILLLLLLVMAAAQKPCAAVYQLLRQPCGYSVPALVTALYQLFYPVKNQASTQSVGELRFIILAGLEESSLQSLSPKEGFHKAFMG